MKYLTLLALFCATHVLYAQDLQLEKIAKEIVDHQITKADIKILEEMKQNNVCLETMQLMQQILNYEQKQQAIYHSKEDIDLAQKELNSLKAKSEEESLLADEELLLYRQAKMAKDEEKAKTHYEASAAHKKKAKEYRNQFREQMAAFDRMVAEYNHQAMGRNMRRQQVNQEKMRLADILSKCYYDFGANNK